MKESSARTKEHDCAAKRPQLQVIDGAHSASHAKPFVKWAGGKKQIIAQLTARLPKNYNRYFEPMIGGGALFFHLAPEKAFISDVVAELINAYSVVQRAVDPLLDDLRQHVHTKAYFYELRGADRSGQMAHWSNVQRASRFIYLNRVCFNGLYRVNSQGHFNVPFGEYKNPRLVDEANLRACAAALKSTEISVSSFEALEDRAEEGDFVYFDPPYLPLSQTACFTSYSQDGFDMARHEALRDLCQRLDRRRVKFMLSNSSAPAVRELYRMFNLTEIEANRAINSDAQARGKIREVIVTNY
jgi:DNA adenine methylase